MQFLHITFHLFFKFSLIVIFFLLLDILEVLTDLDETSKRKVDILEHFIVSQTDLIARN
jgi:hypothetical protein